jgi:predicted Zn-dependent protease with MMP-like domain
MKNEEFEKLVEEALARLPKKFQKLMDNLVVIVEENAPREVYQRTGASPYSTILGLYHGVPLQHRGPYYGNIPPDVIFIYKKPIEEMCLSEEAVRQKVKEVVFHEVGHYFGLSDKELKEIEAESLESQEE